MMTSLSSGRQGTSLLRKIWQINWSLILLVLVLAGVGFAMLYSAGGGSLEPWAIRQIARAAVGLVLMIVVALVDLRFWMRWAYLGYLVALLMLVAVEVQGSIGMGAQRWLDLGVIQVQPSEIMKITLVLALARWFHAASIEDVGRIHYLAVPALLVAAPVALVMKQPDLGTALMLLMGSTAMLFIVGVRWWKFALGFAAIAAAVPLGWNFLRDYQKARVRVFLDPTLDPLGAGYHIIQSKIALGSGGMFGKGFGLGTQSHLNFLPEKQTDFIFTMLAEEFGMAGSLTLLGLYLLIMIYGYAIAFRCTSQFGRLVAIGIVTAVFLAMFINMAMVMGMIPAKGSTLPMVSYGGSSLIVTMVGFGLLIGVWVHRDVRIGRRVGED
ncbi:MAG TPA: rod shape-determining protein RodA [Candidatus Sulfotelmatobacter sp.]|nr:rod shape-determining protein RodA [Candidatus Sulfotelmatobacter sp.]